MKYFLMMSVSILVFSGCSYKYESSEYRESCSNCCKPKVEYKSLNIGCSGGCSTKVLRYR